MRWLLACLLAFGSLAAADDLSSFLRAYKGGNTELTCKYGRSLYRSEIRDEAILIAAGDACAKADYIDFVGVLQQRLGESAASRKAAVYFSTLVLQKRLIAQFMFEDIGISAYSLPVTDHILSRVFEALKRGSYVLVDQNPKRVQIVDKSELIDIYTNKKTYIDLYRDKKLVERHRYR
ncbi:MAG: hypothetical protein MUP09_10530 [Thiovulaceae bacterium]|nr:hypothetical protein [Sulfurimonadaceae bacterium]